MKMKLIKKEPVAGDVVSFVFDPEQSVATKAGQYFHYILPHDSADDRGVERWFTNSAAPSEGSVRISTRLAGESGSSFKRALDGLEIGQEVEADGPEGSFTVEDFSRNYVFVAGGIGITPIRSILAEAKYNDSPLKATLLYGNRNENIPFKDELDAIAAANPDVVINYLVDPERIDAALVKRYVDAADDPLVYVSGPEPMVKSLGEELKNLGVAEESIKLDDFPGYEAI